MQRKQIHKQTLIYLSLVLIMIMPYWPSLASAAFNSGSTGADGPFEPTTSIALQIPENGVLNYTTITIPTGVTVTFNKNSQNTPITILATGDVTINGNINLNGSAGNYLIPGAGGPGGFDGGQGGAAYKYGRRGEGPGGGGGGTPRTNTDNLSGGGGGGGFGTEGAPGGKYNADAPGGIAGTTYNTERILPPIGGSGGGGAGGTNSYAGGAGGGGGGAIIIASNTSIIINGSIIANGGAGADGEKKYAGGGGGGSGGSIRLIADFISGNGSITANGGSAGGSTWTPGGTGGVGRIRFEASNVLRTAATSPHLSLGYPYAVTPPNTPSLTISTIGGINSPSVPKGSFDAPDVMLPFNTKNPITIVVTGSNIPTGQTVTVKASPSVGSVTSASGTLEGTEASSTTSLSLSIATAYPSIITASVTFQLTAANGAPIYAMGELVEKVRVSSALGGKSLITYITASGKEMQVL